MNMHVTEILAASALGWHSIWKRQGVSYKSFGNMHVHALLAPITQRHPFELLVGDYLSMPMGKGGFTKIGLYADVFSQKPWAFKSKAAAGKNTVDSLKRISQTFTAPNTLMVDGGSHFDCNEVRDYCDSIGTKLHVIAAYAAMAEWPP